MGASTGKFLMDCTSDDMTRDETRIHAADLASSATIILAGTIDSGLAVIRDRKLRDYLCTSTVLITSDWSVLLMIDREAGVYLSQYVSVKYPGVVKFISPDLGPCSGISKLAIQFDEDGIIDDILFRRGLDERTGFAVLYALNPDIIGSWSNDVPFTGAVTASCFDVLATIETLEKLFTPPISLRTVSEVP